MIGHKRKLTEAEVSEIRFERMKGKTLKEIAADHHLSQTMIWNIVQGIAWKVTAPAACPHCHKPL